MALKIEKTKNVLNMELEVILCTNDVDSFDILIRPIFQIGIAVQ
jgi:hypothetical protein